MLKRNTSFHGLLVPVRVFIQPFPSTAREDWGGGSFRVVTLDFLVLGYLV